MKEGRKIKNGTAKRATPNSINPNTHEHNPPPTRTVGMSILHTDNPTTSFGRPRFYNSPFHTANVFNSSAEGSEVVEEKWILADDAMAVEELTLLDSLLGLDAANDQDASLVNGTDGSSPSNFFLHGKSHRQLRHLCRQVLVQQIPGLGIRYWDVGIFAANFFFLIFLLMKIGNMKKKQRHAGGSTMYRDFFVLVCLTTILNILRCGTSVSLSVSNQIEALIDEVLWLLLKGFILTVELCILLFGLLFSQSDSGKGMRYALLFSFLFAVCHTAVQAVIDFKLWDEYLNIDAFRVYSYNGMNWWTLSSACFTLLYILACSIPLVCLRRPCAYHRCSFFFYCFLMALLNFAQMSAAVLISMDCEDGMCLADFVTLAYFTLFAPLVYFTFLRGSARLKANRARFSYRAHTNDPGADGMMPFKFGGLTTASYDDLFDCNRQDSRHLENILHLNYECYHASEDYRDPLQPLMAATPDSTLTSEAANLEFGDMSTSSESRPIIRPPVLSHNCGYSGSNRSSAHRSNGKARNLAMRPDGRLTFSTTSSMN